jgi:hypothetical protein
MIQAGVTERVGVNVKAWKGMLVLRREASAIWTEGAEATKRSGSFATRVI